MIFRQAVLSALEVLLAEHTPDRAELEAALSTPPKPEMGDLAFPCFGLAKVLRKAPPAIAAELAERAQGDASLFEGLVARIEAFGPYLNFFADSPALLAALASALEDGSFFESARASEPERVMIEYSQPNTHKVFHVGHLRNVALGDCLVRAFRARGHEVVGANYYGDFGIDVAKCLWWVRNHPENAVPDTSRGAWLGDAYKDANTALEAARESDEEAGKALFAEVRTVLDGLRADPEISALYRETRQWCLDEFAEVYAWLGVSFDTDFFESELEEAGQRIVDEYLEKGTFVPSQGAVICDLSDEDLGAALVRKSDGTSLYLTWDLVLARRKFDDFDVQRSLYVVGAEQSHHFRQLFATLARMGYERAKDCRHVAYELVMLPEGKMSSRKGTAIPLHVLRSSVEEAIAEKMRSGDDAGERAQWDEARWDEVVRKVSVACLKYGMLRVGDNTRVVFDIDAWTNPEGDSGAYLLYGIARIAGIFRKGGRPELGSLIAGLSSTAAAFGDEHERRLLNHLLDYPRVLATVERDCDASGLAAFLFEGVKEFSRFYHNCPVLKAEPGLREARLALTATAEQVLKHGLQVLGAEPVDEM